MKFKIKYITTLLFFSVLVLCLSVNISAAEINSSIVDPGFIYTNPSIKIDVNGITHLVYSKQNSLIYATSLDKYNNKTIIAQGLDEYLNPSIDIDSNGIVHIAFLGINNSITKVYYLNTKDWTIKDVGIGYDVSPISLKVSDNDIVYIASNKIYSIYDSDIVIASSSDFDTFTIIPIHKFGYQTYPVLALYKDNIHLIYYDWSDGTGLNSNNENVGLYKFKYRNSTDNFINEEVISNELRSFDADMQINSSGGVWVALKDSNQEEVGNEFSSGSIWIINKDDNWTKQRVTNGTTFMQDRPIALDIGGDGVRHLSWSELNNSDATVSILYGRVNSPAVVKLQDVGYDPNLGYVSIDSFNNDPYIIANIHSLADYSFLEEELTLIDLQNEINILNDKINELENRTSFLESIVNEMKKFSFFYDFWLYFNSEDKCIIDNLQCSENVLQKCINYEWTNQEVCNYGCNINKCNDPPKDDCTKISAQFSCSSSYSINTKYVCKSGQGSDSNCNPGQCILQPSWAAKWTYCSKGCNSNNGLCK